MIPMFKKTSRFDVRATKWEKDLISTAAFYNTRGGMSSWLITLGIQEALKTLPLGVIEEILGKYNIDPSDLKEMPAMLSPEDL